MSQSNKASLGTTVEVRSALSRDFFVKMDRASLFEWAEENGVKLPGTVRDTEAVRQFLTKLCTSAFDASTREARTAIPTRVRKPPKRVEPKRIPLDQAAGFFCDKKGSFKALRASERKNRKSYLYDDINREVLERFINPGMTSEWIGSGPTRNQLRFGLADIEINVEDPFTSLCPITGQPDFAKLWIKYTPDRWCVESKSLKLYLMGYRNTGAFHESCVVRIANDLIDVLDPAALEVRGTFSPRGGIAFNPTVRFQRRHKS